MDPTEKAAIRQRIHTALAGKQSLQQVVDDADLLRDINSLHCYLAPRQWALLVSTPGSGHKPDELPLTGVKHLQALFA